MAKRNYLEEDLQKSVLEWSKYIKYKGRPLSDYIHHSPNGGYRNASEARKFKAMGVKAGYPDLTIDIANKKYHGLRIELKRDSRSSLTENQKARIKMLNEEGYLAVVCTGLEQTIATITEYLSDI